MPGVRRSTRRAAADVELLTDILRAAANASEQEQAAISRLLAWAATKQREAAADDAETAAAGRRADEPDEEHGHEARQARRDRHQRQQQQQPQRQQLQQQQQAQQQQRQRQGRERACRPGTGEVATTSPDGADAGAARDDAEDRDEPDPPQQQLQQQQPEQPQRIDYTTHAWDADAAARSGPFHRNQCGTGFAVNSARALHVARNIATICQAPGCGALVDLKSATEQARAAQRQHYEPGDGCAADWADPPCSSCCNRSRFKRRQRQFAQQVEDGDRILVEWPPAVERHVRLRHVADAERTEHLGRVRRRLDGGGNDSPAAEATTADAATTPVATTAPIASPNIEGTAVSPASDPSAANATDAADALTRAAAAAEATTATVTADATRQRARRSAERSTRGSDTAAP